MRIITLSIAIVVCLTGCGTVEIMNATFTVNRNRIGVYQVQAIVTPSKPSVTIEDVYTLVDGFPATQYPLFPVAGSPNLYRGPIPSLSCPEAINLQYGADFERDGVFGRERRTVLDPDPGFHRIPIVGDSPDSCRAGLGVANRLVVNSEVDGVDDNPGDGICSTGETVDDSPVCSLRAAVMEANATRGQDVIDIPPGEYILTLQDPLIREDNPVLAAQVGDLDITDGVTIQGDLDATRADRLNVTINGNDGNRIFDIHPSSISAPERIPYVHIEGVVLTGGDAFNGNEDGRGGGGIRNEGQLQLTRVHVIENQARDGGGILNVGLVNIDRAQIERNCLEAVRCAGGGISNFAEMTVTRSAIVFNEGDDPAGIWSHTGGVRPYAAHVSNSTIAFNVGVAGAAIGSTRIDLHSTTVAFNRDTDRYSPIFVARLRATNSLFVRNSDNRSTPARECNSTGGIEGVGGNVWDAESCRDRTLLQDNQRITDDSFSSDLVYDGFTQSLRLSPAYRDQGTEWDVFCLPNDQNGDPRPVDGNGDSRARCDPGATEWQSR